MAASESSTTSSRGRVKRVASALPTIAVLGGILALAAWGHHTGWRAPKLSTLMGRSESRPAEDWCASHNVPESKCIACHPELAGESAVNWCKEHGVPESRCTVCHPEILRTGVAGEWCKEHGVPESSCTLCHPEIARKGEVPAKTTGVTVSRGAHEQERAEDHPPQAAHVDRPLRDARTCQKHALKVQFASADAVAKAGVEVGSVVERPMFASVVVNCEVDYDRARVAKLASRAPGTVLRIEKRLGDAVRAGDVLALIDSGEVGRAKAQFLEAAAMSAARARSLERLERSSQAGFRTEAERLEAEGAAREAEARLFSARQALASLGFTLPDAAPAPEAIASLGLAESVVSSLPKGTPVASLLPLAAPFEGTVVARDLAIGESVDSSRVLFEVVDTRRMWVVMDVPQADAHRLALGQEVIYRPDDARDEVVTGSVAWISTAVDEMTRTVKVRADVSNPRGALRAHSFGRAQIVVRTSPNAVAVPSDAIQWEGCCYVVFVRVSETVFQTRKVRLGAKDPAYSEVVVGLLPGEVVATTGSHVLKSEILKSSLGAGCTDD